MAALTLPSPNKCPSIVAAEPFATPSPGYQRKYNTIAHQFLDDEIGAGDVTPAMHAILDVLIDEAVANMKPYPINLSTEQAKTFAGDALKQIDCILLRHGFVYPGHGLVHLLSDGMSPTIYDDPNDLNELRSEVHNIRRAAFIAAHGIGPFYVVDCDTASFIYLAIAEVMKYPLHLIDIPTHNFVRWEIGPDSYVNFETMYGFVTDDAYYRASWAIPDAFVDRGGILRSMNVTEAFAYHDGAVALAWSWRNDYARMIEHYQRAISRDSNRAFAFNNLAWYYAAVPKTELRDGAKAVQYALQAVALFPDGDSLDTLACAHAQRGDFASALQVEADAMQVGYVPFRSNLNAHMALFQQHQPCNDAGFGKDPMPFRPGQNLVRTAMDKDLLRLH
jgi:tetratricopeptide (TPR) repeat protein